uniref:Insulin gene enhancer protein isl-2a-like n=1 Tax=Diabrotica virgifera virgifera TaxID=50390 RepID=A0A6P7GQI0_DIAVI
MYVMLINVIVFRSHQPTNPPLACLQQRAEALTKFLSIASSLSLAAAKQELPSAQTLPIPLLELQQKAQQREPSPHQQGQSELHPQNTTQSQQQTEIQTPVLPQQSPSKNESSSGHSINIRNRTCINKMQTDILLEAFNRHPFVDGIMRQHLAQITGLSSRVVKIWFQNRRQQEKKKYRPSTSD